jgi:hypothetical protein
MTQRAGQFNSCRVKERGKGDFEEKKMKKFNWVFMAAAVVSVLSSGVSRADSPLETVMKNMAGTLTTLSGQYDDPSQSQSTATLCDTLVSQITSAEALMPSTIAGLPTAQQPGEMGKYKAMLDGLVANVAQLRADVLGGKSGDDLDNDVLAIQNAKTAGHKAYKPAN